MDDDAREFTGDVLIDGGVITAVGPDLPQGDAKVVHAEGCLLTPGLVNTHHHLYQTLTRAVPGGQDAEHPRGTMPSWAVASYVL